MTTTGETIERGRQAARTTANPFQSMKPAYQKSVAEHGPMDWMTWTLGYCKQLCGR